MREVFVAWYFIVIGNKPSDPSTNHQQVYLHFDLCWYIWEKNESNCSPSYGLKVRQTGLFNLAMATNLGKGKLWIKTS